MRALPHPQQLGMEILPTASGLELGGRLVPLSISQEKRLALLGKPVSEDLDFHALSPHIGGGKNTASIKMRQMQNKNMPFAKCLGTLDWSSPSTHYFFLHFYLKSTDKKL